MATAQTVRATYGVPDFVVVSNFVDAGAVAQSVLDSTGRATAFASLPYPGENAISAPGVVQVATGQSVPGYPFFVRADYPTTPSAELKDPTGTYSLQAAVDQGKAAGAADVAAAGPQDPVLRSAAHTSGVTDSDGKVTVTAESVVGPLSVGSGTLRIATIRSRSVTVYGKGDKEPKGSAELTIEGAKVGDTAVTIGPDGVRAAGQPVAPPFGPVADPVAKTLSQAGVSARVISAAPINGGAAGDVLEIVSKQGPPGEGAPEGTLVLSLGGATTSITLGQGGDFLPDLPPPTAADIPPDNAAAGVPDSTPASVDAGVASAAEVYPADLGTPAAPDLSGGSAFTTPEVNSPAGSAGTADAGGTFPADSLPEQAYAAPAAGAVTSSVGILPASARQSLRLLFVVVAAAGAVLLSTSTLWRTKGVHATWMRS